MKHFLFVFLICITLCSQVYTADAQVPDPSEWMPDVNLRAAVREALEIPAGASFGQGALERINYLNVSGANEIHTSELVHDITGLEYATNLQTLILTSNKISDLSPLEDLTNLVHLFLNINNISDISPLEDLTNLTTLDLAENGNISDLSPLEDLTNLTHLDLVSCDFSDISSLAGLIHLTSLNLTSNEVVNISPLQDLTSLTSLFLTGNDIVDISSLQDLTSLTILTLDNNNISDISPLQSLTSLTLLQAHDNNISDLTPLQDLTSLTSLYLHNNNISDLTPLQDLTSLTTLYLSDNGSEGSPLTDISPLADLTNLTYLNLSSNPISDITPLADLTKMVNLSLVDNNILNISPLERLTNLEFINLSDNPIASIGNPFVNIQVPEGVQREPFDVTVGFSGEVTGFEQEKLSVTGNATITAWAPQDGGEEYTATITPTTTGTVTFNVSEDVAQGTYKRVLRQLLSANPDLRIRFNSFRKASMSDLIEPNDAAVEQTVLVDPDPPTVSITVPEPPQKDPFEVTVVFNEPVTEFVQSDLSVTNATITVWEPQPDGQEYIATITPIADGTVTFNVAEGVAQDVADNPNTAALPKEVTVDRTRPTIEITANLNPEFEFLHVDFSEQVTGFELEDISITGLDITIIDWRSPESPGTRYSGIIVLNNIVENELTLTIAENVAHDAAGNGNEAATKTIQVDRTPPTVDIRVPEGIQNAPFEVTVKFSEPMVLISEAALEVIGDAEITVWTPGEPRYERFNLSYIENYTATITPESGVEGVITFKLPEERTYDAYYNFNTAAPPKTVRVDNVQPTVRIELPLGIAKNAFDAAVVFSEPVTDFERNEFHILAAGSTSPEATIGDWTSDTGGTRWTVTITPAPDVQEDIFFRVDADVAKDAAGNGNKAAPNNFITADLSRPTVDIVVPEGVQNGPFKVTVKLGEPVRFDQDDLTITGDANVTIAWDVEVALLRYIATITPDVGTEGSVTFAVAEGVAEDAAGNPNTAATPKTVEIDNVRPTVSITTRGRVTAFDSTFEATVEFSEEVNGFEQADLAIGGNVNVTIDWVEDVERVRYIATLTPDAAEGTVTFDIAANVAHDEGGNGNTAATQQTVDVDRVRPTVEIEVPEGVQNSEFTVTIKFSEPVRDFSRGEIAVTGGVARGTTWSGDSDLTPKDTFIATYIPNADTEGTVTFNIAESAAYDVGGANLSLAAAKKTVQIDTLRPTVHITVPLEGPLLISNDPFDATIEFSEPVTGFEQDGLELGSLYATITEWTPEPGGTRYVARITPTTSSAVVELNVPENVAVDVGGNNNHASNSVLVLVRLTSPTTLIEVPQNPQNGEFTVTVEFSEDVTDFALSELVVTGSVHTKTPVTWPTEAADVYTVKITPTADGTLTFNVAENVASRNRAADTQTVLIDRTDPTVEIQVPEDVQNGPFAVTVVFNEPVTEFAQPDLSVTNATITAWTPQDDGETYTAIATPMTTFGTVTFDVAADVAEDAAGNGNTAAPQQTVEVDRTPPTVAIRVPSGVQNGEFDVTVEFSEDVTDFALSELVVTGSAHTRTSVTWPTEAADVYTVKITPTADGTLTFNVAANVAQDAVGSPNAAAPQQTVQVDRTIPTVEIQVPSGVQKDPFPVTVAFNEPVDEFEQADLTVTGSATITAWSPQNNDEMRYIATITPTADTADGEVTFNVAAGVAEDAGGNLNTAAAEQTVRVDNTQPTVAIEVPEGVQNASFSVLVRFSEYVTGFEPSELRVTGGATVTASWDSESPQQEYVATIAPTAGHTGTVTFNVSANVAEDTGGNRNTVATQQTVQVDRTIPTVEIEVPSGLQGDQFDVTVEFSEPVTGFLRSELAMAGVGARVSEWTLKDNGMRYTATVTPNEGVAGTVTFNVAAGAAQDAGGNLNTAATQKTVQVDNSAPTVSIAGPNVVQNAAFTVQIAFSETVSGFVKEDITISGAAATVSMTGSGATYTATITPTAMGELYIQVPADAAQDTADNLNTASNLYSVPVDPVRPTVTISDAPEVVKAEPFPVTITFSEDVTGLTASGITVNGAGATVTGLTGSGTTYTATISPTTNGTLTLWVPANAARDAANNPNTVSNPVTVQVDTTRPTVTIAVPSSTQRGPFEARIVFSETVTGFTDTDISLGGTATATVTDFQENGTTYTATITPTTEGDVTIQVPADTAHDAANNGNTESGTKTVPVDPIKPTVTITDIPTEVQMSPFDVTITFSETVTGFTTSDLSLTGATATGTVTGSGTTYTATITPTSQGQLAIQVPAGAAHDTVNNPNEASDIYTVPIDATPPTVMITNVPTETQTGTFDVTITFSEPVTGFEATDIAFTGDAHAIVSFLAGSEDSYTATILPVYQGDLDIQVPANVAHDNAENPNTASKTVTVPVDPTRPTVEITSVPSTVQTGAFEVTITFSELVTGFTESGIQLTGDASVTPFSGTGTTYTARITPTDNTQGMVGIKILENAAQDSVGNLSTASEVATVSVDLKAPTVEITNVPSDEQAGAFEVTIEFSESVTGFVMGDINLTGAAATVTDLHGSGSGAEYFATITPTAQGSVTIQVPADVAQDIARHQNTASETQTVQVDPTGPSVTITGAPEGVQNGAFTVTIRFSESVTGFEATDITLSADATATLTGSGATYTATITPAVDSEGDVSIQVPEGVAFDNANNPNTESNFQIVPVDRVNPKVTITMAPADVQNGTFDVEITITETVTDFTKEDITLGGDASATVTRLTANADGRIYTATITPTNNVEGDVTIQVPAGAMQDEAGNPNIESNTVPVSVDRVHPTVNITNVPEDVQNGAFDVTIGFSESVTGFTTAGISLTGVAAAVTNLTGSGTTYTATITPTAEDEDGDVKIQVLAGAARDAANNPNTESDTQTVTVDLTHPTVTITAPTTPQNGEFDITIAFSEPVTGLRTQEISITPAGRVQVTRSVPQSDGRTYTVTFASLPNATDGDVMIQVPANAAQDYQGNGNTESNTVTVTVDLTAPTVTITDLPSGVPNGAFDVTIGFSEPVTGFVAADLSLSANATAMLSGSGTTYIAAITPTSSGDVTIQVPADAAQDAATNGNTASETQTVTVDLMGPTVTITDVPSEPQNSAFTVTITFNETVTGFAKTDISLGFDVAASVTTLTETVSGTKYTATITPATDVEEQISLSVPADTAFDAANNGNTASAEHTVRLDTKRPGVTITGPDLEDTQGSAFGATITFTEDVEDFEVGDIELQGGATLWLSGSGKSYTATVTPTAEGTVKLSVNQGLAHDTAGNQNTVSNTYTAQVDATPPSVEIQNVPATVQNAVFEVKIVFDDPVSGFAASDITLTSTLTEGTGNATVLLTSGSDGDTDYTVEITPPANAEGAIAISVPVGVATNAVNHANTASAEHTVPIDTRHPTVTITAPTTTQTDAFDVTITFSESVTDFAQGEIQLTGDASVTSFNGSGATYTAQITPADNTQGTLEIQIPEDVAQDTASNFNTESDAVTVSVDRKVPTVEITNVPTTVQMGAFSVTITFSESVTGFTKTDISLMGAAAEVTNLMGDGAKYITTITPMSQGNLQIQVPANVAQDTAEHPNTASAAHTVPVDSTGPSVTITDAPTTVQNGDFSVTITFTEPVSDFTTADITLGGDVDAAVTGLTANGNTYTATIAPNNNVEGSVTIQVPAGVAHDAANNPNTVSNTRSVSVDSISPTVTITSGSVGEQNGVFDVELTLSETVQDFKAANITLGGDANATVTNLTANGNDYTATITPANSIEGDVTIQVLANAIYDAANNPNAASNSLTVHVDLIPPAANITNVPSGVQSDAFNVTIAFGETVKDFTKSDISLIGSTATATVTGLTQTGITYTATITPTSDGVVSIQVPTDVAQDNANNDNTASSTHTVTIDQTVPTVSIDVPSEPQNGAFEVTVSFNEPVTGFQQSELTITGSATITNWIAETGGTEYTATINPTADGPLQFDVAANVAVDAGGNQNTAATQQSVEVDLTSPTVSINVPDSVQNAAFTVTIEFNEPVSNFVETDLVVSGTSESTITGWDPQDGGTDYIVAITPTATGTAIFNVAADVAQDTAGNLNTATTQQTVQVNLTRPTVSIEVPMDVQNGAFDVTVTFNETVTGFQQSELILSGASASITSWTAKTGGEEYTATINPTADGTIYLDVVENVAQDAGGNQNTAATQQSVEVDLTVPTVSITVPDSVQNGVFEVTVVFNEPVTDFTQAELGVTGTSRASITGWTPQDGGTDYIAAITPTSTGTAIFNVAENIAQDAGGNQNTAATQQTVEVDRTRPTVSITVPSGVKNGIFEVTVVFNEPVTDFTQAELGVTGTAGASITGWTPQDGGTDYIVAITPTATGTAIFNVTENVAEDAGGNQNSAATEQTVQVNLSRPTVSITVPEGVQNGAFDVTVTFGESVTDFLQSELTLSGASASITDWTAKTGGQEYTAEITPDADGTIYLNVVANVAEDAGGNQNTAATRQSVEVDLTRPTVSITVPDSVQNAAFTVTVAFNESVTGFLQSELVVSGTSGASITGWTLQDGGTDYIVAITPTATGTAIFNVTENVAEDAGGNQNSAATEQTVQVNLSHPTVSITVPEDVQNGAFDVTVTFSEAVTGFIQSELTITGSATITNWIAETGGTEYTATITPSADGTLQFDVAANVAVDAGGNQNTAATQQSVEVDLTGPTATISGVPSEPQNSAFSVTITFSESVTDFVADDISLTGTATATATLTGGGTTYAATVTPTAGGSLTIQVPADAAQDTANNGNTASATHTVQIDQTDPTVTITAPTTTQGGAFSVTITFSEDVTGFTTSDISLTGTATATAALTGSGTTYTATITPTSGGNVIIQVPADAAVDAAGNGNTVSSTYTVPVDLAGPSVTITNVPSEPQNDAFSVTITFSESVIGFTASDISLTGATATAMITEGGTTYTATITPTAEGSLTIQVPVDVAQDASNNGNTASATHTVTIDQTAPTVSITAPTSMQNGAFSVTITFSESVTGFAKSEISLTGTASATVTHFTGSGKNYTATITPTSGSSVELQVPANVAQDAANNGNMASGTQTVQVDMTGPTVTITNLPSGEQTGEFDITITFSEPVTGFTGEDISFTGTVNATATLSGGDLSYTATVTPTGEGNLDIQVPANVAMDTAENYNEASQTHTVQVDTLRTDPIIRPDPPDPGFPSAGGRPEPMITIVKADGTIHSNVGIDVEILTSPDPETHPIRFDVVIDFSEPVTGFVQEDFHLSAFRGGESIEQWIVDPGGMRYTAKIKATQNGGVTFWVPANVAQAVEGGQWNVISVKQTVPVWFESIVEPDNQQPHVMIEVPSGAQTGAFDVTVVFNEPVYGFTQDELKVSGTAGASITNWDSQPTWDPQLAQARYTATITPTQNGHVTLNVPADVAQDPANWWNTAAMEVVVPIMMNAGNRPTVLIIPPEGVQRGSFFVVTVEFSEPVTGFIKDDLLCSGTAEISLPQFRPSPDRRSYTFSCQLVRNGMLIVGVNENCAHSDGNSNLGNHPAEPVKVLIWPEDVNQDSVVNVYDAFEVVTHFGQTVVGEPEGNPDVNRDGTVDIDDFQLVDEYLADHRVVEPFALQMLQTLKTSDNSDPDFQYALQTLEARLETEEDVDAPNVSVSVPSGVQNGRFTIAITFTEPISSLPQGVLELTTNTAGATVEPHWTTYSDNATFSTYITPTNSGDIALRVPAGIVNDAAGNANTASETYTVSVDMDRPGVAISGVLSGTQTGVFDVTITFSETVSGFTQSDVSLTGSAASITAWRANADNTVYTATITPTTSGEVTLSVPANVATDAGGNLNTAAPSKTVAVNIPPPIPDPSTSEPEPEPETSEPEPETSEPEPEPETSEPEPEPEPETSEPEPEPEISEPEPEPEISEPEPEPETSEPEPETSEPEPEPETSEPEPETSEPEPEPETSEPEPETSEPEPEPETSEPEPEPEISEPEPEPEPETSEPEPEPETSEPEPEPEISEPEPEPEISEPPIPDPSTWMPDANLRKAVRASLSLTDGNTLTQAKMTDLTELKAAGKGISDITGIEHATNLTTARLASNQISSLSALSGLTTLTILRLQNNSIESISALSGLTNLTELFLQNNQIQDVTRLASLVNLTKLRLRGNPFANTGANAETLNRLRAAGVDIDIPAADEGIFVHGAPTARPIKTQLLANYPNPFNPETWIPYRLATNDSDVQITIYDMRGTVVRQFDLGHKAAGLYQTRSRAVHWDGTNAFGERVSSGLYFYTLTAGDFSATRKMLILK